MRLLLSCLRKLWSLFVDDRAAAVAVVGWLAVACLVPRQLPVGAWSGPILFAGLLVIITVGMRARGR